MVSLNLVLPNAPSLGHNSVPNLPGPKMPDLQLKTPFVIILNGQDLRWCFQQPRCVQGPTTLTQTSQRVCRNYSNKDGSTPANCSMMEFLSAVVRQGQRFIKDNMLLISVSWAFNVVGCFACPKTSSALLPQRRWINRSERVQQRGQQTFHDLPSWHTQALFNASSPVMTDLCAIRLLHASAVAPAVTKNTVPAQSKPSFNKVSLCSSCSQHCRMIVPKQKQGSNTSKPSRVFSVRHDRNTDHLCCSSHFASQNTPRTHATSVDQKTSFVCDGCWTRSWK